jgi:hypothetical protein
MALKVKGVPHFWPVLPEVGVTKDSSEKNSLVRF